MLLRVTGDIDWLCVHLCSRNLSVGGMNNFYFQRLLGIYNADTSHTERKQDNGGRSLHGLFLFANQHSTYLCENFSPSAFFAGLNKV